MKKKILKAVLAALLTLSVLALTACGGSSSKSTMSSASYDMDYEAAAMTTEAYEMDDSAYTMRSSDSSTTVTEGTDLTADAATRKIIYDASMNVTADDPQKAADAVTARCKELGGYVSSSWSSSDDDGIYYVSISLRVPADSLDALVTDAKTAGKVTSYNLSSNDITMSYYDIEARLQAAKAEETQLLALLNQCETVEDIVYVRESLSEVRADIESYQAQINAWDNLVSYATLDLSINRTPKSVVSSEQDSLLSVLEASEVGSEIVLAFRNSARFLVNAIYYIGIFLGYTLLPAAFLFLCIGLPLILTSKKRRAKRAEKKAARETAKNASAPQAAPTQPEKSAKPEKPADSANPADPANPEK